MLSNLGSLQPRIVIVHFTWPSCVQCGLYCATFMPELKLKEVPVGNIGDLMPEGLCILGPHDEV